MMPYGIKIQDVGRPENRVHSGDKFRNGLFIAFQIDIKKTIFRRGRQRSFPENTGQSNQRNFEAAESQYFTEGLNKFCMIVQLKNNQMHGLILENHLRGLAHKKFTVILKRRLTWYQSTRVETGQLGSLAFNTGLFRTSERLSNPANGTAKSATMF